MKTRVMHLSLLLIIAFAVYANAFGNRFVWDDYVFIIDEPAIKDMHNVPRFFSEGTQNLYRPLRTTLYAVTYHFSGFNPIGYHLVGKTLNALTVIVLYLLMVELFASHWAAFWGALVFAVHPVHTEKVTLITSTYDILGDCLWLSAFLCFVIFRRTGGRGYFASALALFGLGLLAAENAAVLPLLVVLYDVTIGARSRNTRQWLPFFLILGAYLLLRTHVLGVVARTGGVFAPDLTSTLFTMSGVVAHYFRLLFVPWPLNVVPETVMASAPYPADLYAALAGVGTAIGIALWSMRKYPAAAFSFLWFFAVLSPNLNFIPTGTVMAERYLYLPSASLAFFIALLFMRPYFGADAPEAKRRRMALIAVIVAVAAVFAAVAARRNRDWRDELALWTSTLAVKPDSYIAKTNLAAELWRLEQFDAVEPVLRSAIASNPGRGDAQLMLGERYLTRGKYEEAEMLFHQSEAVPHLNSKALLNIAVIRLHQKRHAEAERILAALLEKYPDSTLALNNFGYLLHEQGRRGWWVPYLRIHRITGDPAPIVTVAEGFLGEGDARMAEKFARIGLSAAPEHKRLRELVSAAAAKK
ncbi:MAG: tetratricopeptide repeat protein [Nitrospinae bacterium]|nr:tetratricopeptide repeat protein [Nitrospinota bacterium]